MKSRGCIAFAAAIFALHQSVSACIWDSDTLAAEKAKSPKMADAILGKPPQLGDPTELRARIAKLEADRKENDPAWWSDLAGAHIRLGEPQKAATLLESVLTRFPDDYGIHANLGTAYHLLGRYADAEKEIARDLEINPDAHFGLEKYHLALLQYLSKDDAYKKSHVYVDDFTDCFLNNQLVWGPSDEPPMYRLNWDSENATNRENGVLYMAALNPREPACFVMLGIVCLEPTDYRSQDLNLAVAAFQKAIELGSPQAEILKRRIDHIKKYIGTAQHAEKRRAELAAPQAPASPKGVIIGFATALAITVALCWGATRQKRTP